jgi:hypothetical protein
MTEKTSRPAGDRAAEKSIGGGVSSVSILQHGTAYDRLVGCLRAHGKAVRETRSGQASAQCPAHDDHDPSLSIRRIEGQSLIYCHAGCDTRDVLAALNLSMRDLYDAPITDYAYTDSLGTVTRTVHRTYQGDKRKIWQGGNTKAMDLYRLPAVIEAIKNDATIYIVEGEKDVHALELLGAVATTSPEGAGKWSKIDPTPLYGGKIVVVADKDSPGRKHAREVAASLDGMVQSLQVVEAKIGKDPADHVAAGYGVGEFMPIESPEPQEPTNEPTRRIRLTPASAIRPRPVRWLWEDRIPAGELTLTPGRGGIGKSTFHAWIIAHLTCGTLTGVHFGTPKPCVIAASEDSWDRTIVPRLIAADADMDLVYRVDIVTETNEVVSISLPCDVEGLTGEITGIGAALLSVDPVMSVLSNTLDTHKDREVRQALEPLGRLADRTGCVVLGNAHFNKSSGNDPLSLIMGSAAFGNVARAALGFARDTEAEDESCVISQVKNNLGRLDLPSLRYRIDSATIDTEEGPAEVGRLVMLGESDRSVADILSDRNTRDNSDDVEDVEVWLADLLKHGRMEANAIYRAADANGYSKDKAKRAKKKLGIVATHPDINGPWFWEPPQGSNKGAKGAGFENGAPLLPVDAPLEEGGETS